MCIPRGKKIGIENLLSMAMMELIRMDIYCVWGRAESIHLWISETEYF